MLAPRLLLAAALFASMHACAQAHAQSAPPSTHAGDVTFVEAVTAGARAYDRLPLVVALHGLGDTSERFIGFLGLLRVPARLAATRGLDRWHGGFAWIPSSTSRFVSM